MLLVGMTAVLFATFCLPARADDDATLDEQGVAWLAKQRAKHTGMGQVIIDVAAYSGNSPCDRSRLTIGIALQGRRAQATLMGYYSSLFGTSFGGIKSLPAGIYLVDRVECEGYKIRRTINGPHARFEVREGELVNLGLLKIIYTSDNAWWDMSGKIERTVHPLPAKTVEWLTRKFPRFYRTAIYRPMTLTGPVTNAVHQQ